MRRFLAALAALTGLAAASLLWPAEAEAATCTSTIDNLVFSPVDTLSGATATASGTVSITCTSLLGTAVCASIGAGSGGSVGGVRLMSRAGGGTLRYRLFQDPGLSVPWGSFDDSTLGTVPLITLAAGTRTVTRPIYAQVLSGQPGALAGDYSSSFIGATGFFYGEVTLLNCAVNLLGSVVRPPFEVRASVLSNCFVEADNLNFGPHGVFAQAITASTALRVRCTPGTPYSIGLGESSGTARRLMRSAAGATIEYGLFRDDAFSVPWLFTGGPTGLGDGNQRSFPVYGRVPPRATPPQGTYTDTVLVTVTY